MVHLINWMNGVRYVWFGVSEWTGTTCVPPLPIFYRLGFLEGNDDFTHRCAEIIEYLIRAIINTSVVRILSFVLFDYITAYASMWNEGVIKLNTNSYRSFTSYTTDMYRSIEDNISFIRQSFSSKIEFIEPNVLNL